MPNIEQNRVVLYPHQNFLFSGVAIELQKESIARKITLPILEEFYKKFYTEYCFLLKEITNLFGQENIIIVKNKIINMQKMETEEVNPPINPVIDKFNYLNISLKIKQSNKSALQNMYNIPTVWTRDGFVTFNDFTLINPKYFDKNEIPESDSIIYSFLGEGGSVLTIDKIVLITEELSKYGENDKGYEKLIDNGYQLEPLPLVDATKQRYDFNYHHIDGHASLIKSKTGELFFLVAKSYYEQGQETDIKITKTAKNINAQLIIIDDSRSNFPNMGLNIIQSKDTTIIAQTTSNHKYRNPLLEVIDRDVNVKRIALIPFHHISNSLLGGPRCATNFSRVDFIRQIII